MDPWQALTGSVALVGTFIAAFALARLPRTSIRLPLYAFVLGGLCWAVGDIAADSARDAFTKQIWISVLYTGSISMPALWWLIVLRWAREADVRLPLRSPAWHWVPLAWAGAMWLLMITNSLHGAFLTPVVGGRNVYQPLWYAMAVPNYGLILAALALEIAVAVRGARRAVRRQAGFLIAASATTLLANFLYVTAVLPLNLTVIALSTSVSLLLVGMARDGLFGVLPEALSVIADEHPEGVIVIGSDGHVGYANRKAHSLLAPIVLHMDRPILETLQDPALRPANTLPPGPTQAARWWQALNGASGVLFQLRGERLRWIQVIATPVGNSRAGGRSRLLHLSDITERRQAELHAGQTRRLESVAALARSVSRDFLGAFAIVRGNAELLDREVQGDAPGRHLGRIFEAAQMGADLAHQLQLYAGSVNAVRVTLDLSGVVSETCDLVSLDLPPNLQIERRLSDRLLPVEADPIHIRDCIFNLLTNAIEATSEAGGRVEVTTGNGRFDPRHIAELVWGAAEKPGEFAWVRIRDEGGGMDAETEERAFEPFFSTRQKDRGNGLSTALGIARAHDGLLALENDPGRGCAFTLYLPRTPSR